MDSWLLRWDTRNEARPSVFLPGPPGGRESRSHQATRPDGRACVFDGYLFETPPALAAARTVLDRSDLPPRRLLDSLRGAFAFALWDDQRRRLLVARDTMGVHPLFYSWSDATLVASPSFRALRARGDIGGGINRQLVAEMLVARFNDRQIHETYFEALHRLPPAHCLHCVEGRLDLERYWDPVPPGFEWASDEELARFPDRLEAAVARCLDAGADSLSLSGGFDSVSLAIVMAELKGHRRPAHALCLRLPGDLQDESATQRAVAAELGMPLTMRTVDECLAGRPLMEDALRRSADSPGPAMSLWQSAYTTLLEVGSEQGLEGLVFGTGGDEALGVDGAYGADCLASGRWSALWRFFQAARRTSSSSAARVARFVFWETGFRRLGLGFATQAAARLGPGTAARLETIRVRRWHQRAPWLNIDHLRHMPSREISPPIEESGAEALYRHKLRRVALHPVQMLGMDQSSNWAYGLGYRCFYPYWDRDLVELLLRAHPEKLIEGGRFKSPLRRLVADRLERIELQPRKVDFTERAVDLLRRLEPEARRTLDGRLELARLRIADGDGLRALVDDFFAGRSDDIPTVWEILSTEHWLRAQRDVDLHPEAFPVLPLPVGNPHEEATWRS